MVAVIVLLIVTIVLLGTKPISVGDTIIRFVIQYIVAIWLLLPFVLSFFVDGVKDNIPVGQDDLLNSYLLESGGMMLTICFYLLFQQLYKLSTNCNRCLDVRAETVKFVGINKLGFIAAFVLISISCLYSIVNPSSYQDVNLVGSTSGIGGGFGLPLYEPLLISILSAFVVVNRCKTKASKVTLLLISLYAVIKLLQGGRFAIAYPLIPVLFEMILRSGRFSTAIKIVTLFIFFIPLVAVVVIGGALMRDGDSIDIDPSNLSSVGTLLLLHFYLKFSGVTNAAFLSLHANTVSSSEAITTIVGPLFSFVPRFIWPGKPISGSLDGTEDGLPYRIAAKLMNYPDWGNVALSPFTTSEWIYSWTGLLLTGLFIAVNMFFASRLVDAGFRGKLLLASIGFYMLGLPHLSAMWVSFAPGMGLFSNSVFMVFIVMLVVSVIRAFNRGRKIE